ncbi:MAG: hypothetical protein ACD_75C00455G0004 [uncultured bacterium]|nr:MAG: hypothetical protein ACD_75C00455G0004 [uncultured bacterium]
MPFGDNLGDMLFHPVEGRQVFGLDQDTKQSVGVKQHLSKGHRHHHQFLSIEPQGTALRTKNTDDPATKSAEFDQFTQGGVPAEEFMINLRPEHTDRTSYI